MLGSETDGEFGDTPVCNGEPQNMTESRYPWECPGLQRPGNSVMGMAQAELCEDSRTEISGEMQDRTEEAGRGFCDCRLEMTRQLQGRNDGCCV